MATKKAQDRNGQQVVVGSRVALVDPECPWSGEDNLLHGLTATVVEVQGYGQAGTNVVLALEATREEMARRYGADVGSWQLEDLCGAEAFAGTEAAARAAGRPMVEDDSRRLEVLPPAQMATETLTIWARDGQTVVHVVVGTTPEDAHREALVQARKALLVDEAWGVRWDDGTRQVLDTVPLVDLGVIGSGAYTWDRSGNRCKHARVLRTWRPDNSYEDEHLGWTWRKLES